MGQMKWGRETSEKCDQDNAMKNPSSVHRVRRRMTESAELESLERKTKKMIK